MADSAGVVQLILQAKDLASQTINHVRGGMEKLGVTGDSTGKSFSSLRGGVDSFNSSFRQTLKDIGAVYVAYKGLQALLSLPLKGLEFSKQMETARLGIASIIAATQDLTAQDGKRLTGMEKLNAAQKIAAELMKEIQIAGLETVATTEELVSGFQVMLGPAAEAGLTLSQTKDVTVSIVQAMGAMGINMNQLSAEGRSLLDGSIIPTQDRLAVTLGITGEMVKKWREQGVLYDELSKKLEPFKLAGADLSNTWTGLISNLKEGIAFIASRMTGGLFEDVKASLKTMLDIFIDLKNFDVGSGIKELVEGFKEVGKDIGSVIRAGAETFVSLLKQANVYVSEHKQELSAIWDTVKLIGGQFWELIKQVVTFGGEIANAGVEGGIILDILKFINLVLAMANDIVGYIVLGFKAVAAIIWNTVVPPLAEAANIVGNILKAIPGFSGIGDSLVSMAVAWRQQQAAINQELVKSAEQYRDGIAPHTQKALKTNQEIEESLKKQNTALDDEEVKIEKIKLAYEDWKKGIEKGSETYINIQAQEIKALEARIGYEKALLDKALAEKTITQEEYVKKVQALDEQLYNAKIEHINMQIEAEKKGGEDHYEKVAALETSKTELTFKHAADRTKIETDSYKEKEKLQADDLKTWQAFQDLKLQALKAQYDLEGALDDAAVKAGILRESTAMANKLDRLQKIYDEQLRMAEETASKEAELHGWDSKEYAKAIADKEKIQADWEQNVIASESNIAEKKKQEAQEAESFIADLLNDSFRQDEVRRQEQLDQLNRFYQQGLISAEDYFDAMEILDDQYTSEFKRDLQERTEQLNLAIEIILERRQRLEATLQGMLSQSFDDIEHYFGDWKTALSTDVDDMQAEIDQFMRHTTMVGADMYFNTTLYGRRMIDMTGTTIYEWAQRVSEYVVYVKNLMLSLQETIEGYRMQLLQLRGDRLGELELWRKQAREKLEEQFKDLKGTREYYDALALLDELYAEKKKKITEDMKNEVGEQTAGRSSTAPGGIAGGLSFPDFASNIKDNFTFEMGDMGTTSTQVIEKTLKLDLTMNSPPTYDTEGTRRWLDQELWPQLSRKLELLGVKLG